MNIPAVRFYGDPILEAPTTPVSEITDNIKMIAAEMVEAMYFHLGVGLAANQIGYSHRMFVWDSGDGTGAHVAINPEVFTDPLDIEVTPEGCLSVPKFGWQISRSYKATLTAFDLDGNQYRIEGERLLARIFQHETDHLDGYLLLEHIGEAERGHFTSLWDANRPQ